MKIKLNSTDILEISKALKCGWIDIGKIACFKNLLDGYRPQKEITKKQVEFYLDCLFRGWGFIPNDEATVTKKMMENKELKERLGNRLYSGDAYNELVKYALVGLLAIKGLGGIFIDKEADFGFYDEPIL